MVTFLIAVAVLAGLFVLAVLCGNDTSASSERRFHDRRHPGIF